MPVRGRHLNLPRGMHDVVPEQSETYLQLRQHWFRVCKLAGYQPAEVPPVGFAETFTTGHHASGERTYRFPDRAGRELALISDSLPAILRLAKARNLPDQRISHCTPIFRYERRPRRYFHHLGVTEIRADSLNPQEQRRAIARLVLTIASFLDGTPPLMVVLSDPGVWRGIVTQVTSEDEVAATLNLLRCTPRQERAAVLHHLGADAENIKLAEQISAAPSNTELRSADGPTAVRAENCRLLAAYLRERGVDATIDLAELHASEFHDGPSFLLRTGGSERLLGDGGSYAPFARSFLGASTAVHSAVIGLERLADLQGATQAAPPASIAILINPRDDIAKLADAICADLRHNGIPVWDILLTQPLGHHLRDIALLGIPNSAIISERELDGTTLVVRVRNGQHHTVPRSDLAAWLTSRGR